MTDTLKANPDGTIRALPQMRDWYDTEPRLGLPSATCTCCLKNPLDPVTRGFVDTEEKATVTGSGTAYYPSLFLEFGGSGNVPTTSFSFGGVGTVEVKIYPPGSIGSPANTNYELHIKTTLGTDEDILVQDIGPDNPGEMTVAATCSFPARLFATIDEIGRYDKSYPQAIWKAPAAGGNIDMQGYKTAELEWYYHPDDAVAATKVICAVTVGGNTYTVTSLGAGPPQHVTAGSATQTLIGTTGFTGAYLDFQFWGSPALDPADDTVWRATTPPEVDGGHCWTDGHTLRLEGVGTGCTFRAGQLSRTNVQPDRQITVAALASRANGAVWPAETFPIQAQEGPKDIGGTALIVNSEYPIGTAISLSAPGTWTGTGRSYAYSASGLMDSPGSSYLIFNNVNSDTIGTPYLGFAYTGAGLTAAGQDPDAWRFPLRIPAASASWESLSLWQKVSAHALALAAWSPQNGGTSCAVVGTGVRVYGTGDLWVQKAIPESFGFSTVRYVTIKVTPTVGSQAVTFCAPTGKEWALVCATAGTEQTFVIDLCAPTNATGFDATYTRKEALSGANGQGGFGFGVENAVGGVDIDLKSSAEFSFREFAPYWKQGSGLVVAGEAIYGDEAAFLQAEYPDAPEPYEAYIRRELLWLPEGRIAFDFDAGLMQIGREVGGFDQSVETTLSIQASVEQELLRTGFYGLCSIKNLRPRTGGWVTRNYTVGGVVTPFRYYPAAYYFHNGVEAYQLRPCAASTSGAGHHKLFADYCVDRVQVGVGPTWTFTSRRLIGGGVHGITLDTNNAAASLAVEVTENSDTATLLSNGVYELPDNENFALGSTYHLTPAAGAFEGPPSVSVLQGVSKRLVVIDT
jgi:hypothetical protein